MRGSWSICVLVGLAAVPGAWAEQPLQLSLREAQARALEHNLMLEVARQGVAEARAVKLQTWAGYLPAISLSEQALRSNDAVNAFGFRLKQEAFTQADFAINRLNYPEAVTDFQTTLEVRQPLFNGGQAFFGRRQAVAGLRAAEAQLQRHIQEVMLRTTEAYWGLVLAGEALKAVQQGLETVQAHAAVALNHYQQQTAPRTDLLAAQVRVAELRNEEIAGINRIAEAGDGLGLVVGLDTGIQVAPADTLALLTLELSLAEWVQTALASRPDLLVLEQQSEAARQGVRVARAAQLPHLNAFARFDLDADEPFARQGESWTVGAMMTWNLFSGFHTAGAVQQARAQAAQARTRSAFLSQQVEREVRQAFREVEAARSRIGVAEEAVGQAEERLRITSLQYKEGVVTATDLLAAETGLTQARIRRLQALHDLNVGLARLSFAGARPLELDLK